MGVNAGAGTTVMRGSNLSFREQSENCDACGCFLQQDLQMSYEHLPAAHHDVHCIDVWLQQAFDIFIFMFNR